MFNETQTYKDRLIQRLEQKERAYEKERIYYLNRGHIHAATACCHMRMGVTRCLHIIQENDIPAVMQEPIKTK